MAEKLVVPWDHDSSDLTQIWLSVTVGEPTEADWRPVLRDTIAGQRVIWVKYDQVPQGNLWIRDSSGVRRIER